MRALLLVLAVVGLVAAQSQTTGRKYAVRIQVAGTATAYSDSIEFKDWTGAAIVAKVNDTTSAGFASDSVNVGWGYQLGYKTVTSAGATKVLWGSRDRVAVDTMATMGAADVGFSYQAVTVSGIDGQKAVYAKAGATGLIDTTKVSGYAVQRRTSYFEPGADYIRFYALGLTGNNADTLDMVVEPRFYNE
jgi:hypothetical protein